MSREHKQHKQQEISNITMHAGNKRRSSQTGMYLTASESEDDCSSSSRTSRNKQQKKKGRGGDAITDKLPFSDDIANPGINGTSPWVAVSMY
jgi:hypothetical protein